MNFFHYLKDKRNFFILNMIIMFFVSLMMIVSTDSRNAVSNIVYTNMVIFFIVAIYVIIEYYYNREFYRELNDVVESNHEEFLATLPKPRNDEQLLYLELLKKVNSVHGDQLQKLYNEKMDHQDFITSWIHEVKVPIAAGRLLMENSNGRTVENLVDKFEDELDRIENYVEQALYYSRIDSFSKDYFISEVVLDQVAKNSVKKFAKSFINKQIRFHMDNIEQVVHTDSKWLGFIMDQVFSNSLKYTGEGGEISVQFEEDRKEKRLQIQDTSIGIKPEDISRVFEKGFTGSIGRSHAKSTGLGLYLAKEMALKLGHDLSIHSEDGKYTKVIIHFPKIRNYYHL